VLFGAAFYDEYRITGSREQDLDLMQQAGFSVIRVGESVWSTWEPRPDEFDLEWLEPILDAAHQRDISVILGTPTYAVPAWLSVAHPEIAAHDATGHAVPWGSRQEINVAHPVFRQRAEKVIRRVIGRYAQHPAVIGYQVDNEPGLHLLHNPDVFAGFLDYLRERYVTLDELNRQWGLTYWSHRLTDWAQLWAPDGNHSPQYQLEWRRYQTTVITDFIAWQAGIVREYARDDQFVTTCISYERPAVNDVELVRSLDVSAGNPYYKMQDALRIGVEVPRNEIWWSSGVWALFEQADRMYSTAQERFLVMETNAQSIGQSHWQNHPPYPGQIAQAAFALISRGARMIEYWQWQTLHAGIETYWGGVMPHSGQPGRIYREIAALGHRIRALEPELREYRPEADVAFVYSTDTKHAFEFYPPLATDTDGPDVHAYLRIFDAFYRGAFEAKAQARLVHMTQFAAQDAASFAHEHPVLFVPTLYVASDADLDALVAYVEAGGHLILGIRTGYGDELARARPERAPGRLATLAGFSYDEFTNLDAPIDIMSDTFATTSHRSAATGWADRLVLEDAESLATFAGGIYDGMPAITTRQAGSGRVTYVGTVPSAQLAREIVAWAVPAPRASAWHADETVTVTSGVSTTGTIWFVSNWSPVDAAATAPTDLQGEHEAIAAGTRFRLPPWSVQVFCRASSSE
jgi:beta-galactosidase